MTIPGPLELVSDADLLHELCRRAKSDTHRAFVGMYLRPDEGQSASGGWLIASAARSAEIRETVLLLLGKLGVGAPCDYRWLWEELVPQYGFQPEAVELTVHPQNTGVMAVVLASARRWPMITDDAQFLLSVDEIMARHQLVRRAYAAGWEYVTALGTVKLRLKRSTSLLFTGV